MKIYITLLCLLFTNYSSRTADLGVEYYLEIRINGKKLYASIFMDQANLDENQFHENSETNEYIRSRIKNKYRVNKGIYNNIIVKNVMINMADTGHYLSESNKATFYLLTDELQHFTTTNDPKIELVTIVGWVGFGGMFSPNVVIDSDWLSSNTIHHLFSVERDICIYNFYGVTDWFELEELEIYRSKLKKCVDTNDIEGFSKTLEEIYANDIIMLGQCAC